ncbi:MAG: 2-hydroxychromene-2-carboxylate isomerase [Pseudomonadota bacterium]
MTKTLEFFFDFGSPATYLAFTQAEPLAKRLGAEIIYKPMLLGGVFKATGNQSPVMIAPKGAWMTKDLQRWAAFYKVAFRFPERFPINTLPLMRGAVAYRDTEKFEPYLHAMFRTMWVEGVPLDTPEAIGTALTAAGIDPAEFQARIEDESVKDELKRLTGEAVERGVFGAPTFFVGDEMFFGQDRLHFVGEALAAQSN